MLLEMKNTHTTYQGISLPGETYNRAYKYAVQQLQQ